MGTRETVTSLPGCQRPSLEGTDKRARADPQGMFKCEASLGNTEETLSQNKIKTKTPHRVYGMFYNCTRF